MHYDQSYGCHVKYIGLKKTSKVIDNIAEWYGHEVLRLPQYHCDLNAIELIWADKKNFVAHDNNEMTLQSVETLLRKRREEIIAELCKKLRRTCQTSRKFLLENRSIDQKMDKLEINLDSNEDESDMETDSDDNA